MSDIDMTSTRDKRARQLLMDSLDDYQRVTMKREERFIVNGSDERKYLLKKSWSYSIEYIVPSGHGSYVSIASICVMPVSYFDALGISLYDWMYQIKNMLETPDGPEIIIRIGNVKFREYGGYEQYGDSFRLFMYQSMMNRDIRRLEEVVGVNKAY